MRVKMDNLTERTNNVWHFKKMADGRAIDMNMITEHLAAYESLGRIEYLQALVRADQATAKINISTLRALLTAANSLRFNPQLDSNEAALYESLLFRLRDDLMARSVGTA